MMKLFRYLPFYLLLAVATLLAPRFGSAQETGQIAGTVTDSSGAVVPNAVLSAKNLGTNAVRTASANSSGSFVFTGLQPAVYEVTTQVAGFAPYTARVEVTVAGHITVDAKLSVNQANSVVEVSAAGGTEVNTQTQEISQVVSALQVSQLPSLTRNPYDFVAISGNVSGGDNTSAGATQNTTEYGIGFSLNGQRSSGTEILLDGVENVAVFGDGVGITVPIDAVQEYRITTSNFDQQFRAAVRPCLRRRCQRGYENRH